MAKAHDVFSYQTISQDKSAYIQHREAGIGEEQKYQSLSQTRIDCLFKEVIFAFIFKGQVTEIERERKRD